MGLFRKLRQQENRLKFEMLISLDEQKAIQELKQAKKRKKETIKGYIEKFIPDSKELKRKYNTKVRKLTKQVDKTKIQGYNKDLIYNHKKDGSMVIAYNRLIIDHKIPLSYGYKNGIRPEDIADISNLQYITVKENMIKGMKPLIDDLNEWIINKA